MTPLVILICIGVYFAILLGISYITTRQVSSDAYFIGNKSSKWYVIAFGMLGDSLSGVTFISVPGAVLLTSFGYFQIVLGYFIGYFIIAHILLPLYYRMNLVSIYGYLHERYGAKTQRTGSYIFMISRILGSAARLYLATSVLQLFIFDAWNIPYWVSVTVIIVAIWLYTIRGGIKTLVWTDAFQSGLLIAGVICSIYAICMEMDMSLGDAMNKVSHHPYSRIFYWDIWDKSNFFKQFIGGIFIAVCMTGLDQNMMQKNLSCRTLAESQKNLQWFSVIMLIVNLFFLSLGVLLYIYADTKGISLPLKPDGSVFTDQVFPFLALNHLGLFAAIFFVVGLTAATFSSADSVLTTLTTSFYIDILGHKADEESSNHLRYAIHIGFAAILLVAILIIRATNTSTVIDIVLKIANYTYGPLLGLFAFGILTARRIKDGWIPWICLVAPIIAYILDLNPIVFGEHKFQYGNTILIINGLITFVLLFLLSSSFRKNLQSRS